MLIAVTHAATNATTPTAMLIAKFMVGNAERAGNAEDTRL